MKKQLQFLFMLSFVWVNSQVIITPNPFNVNSGTITFTYGANADYSLFDPVSNPNLYLYTGLNTDDVLDTWEFHDDWNTVSSLIPLTWNSTANAYVATFNLATRNYTQESTQTVTTLPTGTNVNGWYFIIRNEMGNMQSSNLVGANYGFTSSAVLSNLSFELKNDLYVYNQLLISQLSEDVNVELFNALGQLIQNKTLMSKSNWDLSSFEKGLYFVTVSFKNVHYKLKLIL